MQRWPRHHQPAQPWSVLLLWTATLLFVFQVGLHAAMPQGMNMSEMVGGLFTALPPEAPPRELTTHGAMPGMSVQPQHPDSPAHPARHAAEGLCCMPPVAVLPTFWILPEPLLLRETQTPPRTLREARLRLRATARGPPQH